MCRDPVVGEDDRVHQNMISPKGPLLALQLHPSEATVRTQMLNFHHGLFISPCPVTLAVATPRQYPRVQAVCSLELGPLGTLPPLYVPWTVNDIRNRQACQICQFC